MQDRKQQVQWNKDPPVKQVNFKNIGTYRPRYLNGYALSNSSIASSGVNQSNLSMPDLGTIPEDSIISAEAGGVRSSLDITHSMDTLHNGGLRSGSMDGLLGNIDSRHITNPLHDSDDSSIQLSPTVTSKDQLFCEDSKAIANPLHDSDEPSKKKNGFVHHTFTKDEQSNSEGDCNDSKKLKVILTMSRTHQL